MIPEDQRDTFAFLARPESHGPSVERVDQVHTHISAIFLAAGRALKLKRAVRLPFVDFTTLDSRRIACEAEVRLNRRGAPDLYEGVAAVTRDADGRLALDGDGDVVDWLVVMRRFDEQDLFSRLLVRGELTRDRATALARVITDYHAGAEVVPCADNAARMVAVARGNRDSMMASAPVVLPRETVETLTARTVAALNDHADVLIRRGRAGRVRRCHGDLHLRNICLWNDEPTLFDAIEFSDAFQVIDTLYDLAFLLMDLDQRGFRRLASIVMNHAMEHDPDIEGLALLPVFLSMRAGIRAHISATMSLNTSDPAHAQEMGRRALAYLDRAQGYLAPPAPRLIAVGGLSGSGKSRLARELAPHVGAAPGALVSRTDVLRKRLMGVGPYEHLGPDGYTEDMTRRTYAALDAECRAALARGHAVIADGVFATPGERADIEQVAREMGVPFDGLWLEAPEDVARKRIGARQANASDATAEVLAFQRTLDTGPMAWPRIDSSGPRRETLARAREIVGL
ncbi:AAA family ATPase [Roseospira navarrensis]|uniref:AAA family ATPase n=2 Tax=Roseospira navarrensis TaxID=140058 RepID=A0A7X2D3C5_9PROT|nr:AAA family ATPase [Roseospira navarrensis]